MAENNKTVTIEIDMAEDAPKLNRKKPFHFFTVIFCFLLAFGVWLYVVNLDTDDYEKTFTLVAVDIEGVSELSNKNLSIIDQGRTAVSVTVKGRRGDITSLSSGDFSAYVNVSGADASGSNLFSVNVRTPENVMLEVVACEPSEVIVEIDEISTKSIDVRVDETFIISPNNTIGEITTNVQTVNVMGPKRIIESIVAAVADIDLSEIFESKIIKTDIVLLDQDNNPLNNKFVKCDVTSVIVNIPIFTEKTIKLECAIKPGLDSSTIESIKALPETITVYGETTALSKLNSITVYTLDRLPEDRVFDVDFDESLLPSGITLKTPVDKITVEVIVDIPADVTEAETTDAETNEQNQD